MRKTYQKQVEASPTEMHVDSPDEIFIKKVLLLIDNNISNPNFSVEELSSEVFVSRYTLYKKILAMTGKTQTNWYAPCASNAPPNCWKPGTLPYRKYVTRWVLRAKSIL